MEIADKDLLTHRFRYLGTCRTTQQGPEGFEFSFRTRHHEREAEITPHVQHDGDESR